jgi:hypothetical protein
LHATTCTIATVLRPMMSNTERSLLHRKRKRRGERPVTVIVSEQVIDFLMARGYLETRDKESISWAVSAFLSDSVLEGA